MTSNLAVLPACGHMYHETCITPWVKAHKNCPECRKKAYGAVSIYYTVQEDALSASPSKDASTSSSSSFSPTALNVAKERIKKLQLMIQNISEENKTYQIKINESKRLIRQQQADIQTFNNDITKNKRKMFRLAKENTDLKSHIDKINKEKFNLQKIHNAREYSQTMDLYSLIKKTKGNDEASSKVIEQQHIALQMSRKNYDKLLSQKNMNDKEIIGYKSKIKALKLKLKDIVAMKGDVYSPHKMYVNSNDNFKSYNNVKYHTGNRELEDRDIDNLFKMHRANNKRKREYGGNQQIVLKRSNSVPAETSSQSNSQHKHVTSSSQNESKIVDVSKDAYNVNKMKRQQQQQIMWANPFRNKTNQTGSTRSFLSNKNKKSSNKQNIGNQSKGTFIKKGYNGLGGTHKVCVPKKKSLITNHVTKMKNRLNKVNNGITQKQSSINPFIKKGWCSSFMFFSSHIKARNRI
eukprot:g4357.t1